MCLASEAGKPGIICNYQMSFLSSPGPATWSTQEQTLVKHLDKEICNPVLFQKCIDKDSHLEIC